MADFIDEYFQQHVAAVGRVAAELGPKIRVVGQMLCGALGRGNKILTFGNGGSAADAMHFAEEMTGRYMRERRPLAAVCLNSDGPALTCIANDFGYTEVFARPVTALAHSGDVVIGISTSGNSENVIRGLAAGKDKGATTVALLGRGGGKIRDEVDHALVVPAATSPNHVQEMHIVIVHLLCEMVDRWAAGE